MGPVKLVAFDATEQRWGTVKDTWGKLGHACLSTTAGGFCLYTFVSTGHTYLSACRGALKIKERGLRGQDRLRQHGAPAQQDQGQVQLPHQGAPDFRLQGLGANTILGAV